MANPSLQIGNSNWAIKEDNLLGYSASGTRFFPIPITMTRATAGTRVNSSGLVETVELLGSELVVNGDFTNNVTGWNKFKSNATESWNSGGYLDFTKTGVSGRLGSDVSLETNKTYKISVNVISKGGILDLYVGLSDFESPYAGVWSAPLVVGANAFYLTYTGSASSKGVYLQSAGSSYFGLTASIDSISVKEYTVNNLARVNYTGSTSSLLAEPQSTNLITYPVSFDNAYWTKSGATVTGGFTSPSADYTTSAYKLVADTSNANIISRPQLISNTANTNSIYLKRVLGTGTVSIFNAAGNETLVTLTNEWQRFSTSISVNPANAYHGVRVYDLGDEVMVFGAQTEQLSYPTSLIYNGVEGSTVTRNKDQYTKTGISDKINSEEGVLFVEIANLLSSGGDGYLSLSDGTPSNRVTIRFTATTNNLACQYVISNINQTSMDNVLTDRTVFNKIAFRYSLNNFSVWVNGIELSTDTSGSVLPNDTLVKLSFDNGVAGNSPFYGKVKQLQVFKTALSDSELIALTS